MIRKKERKKRIKRLNSFVEARYIATILINLFLPLKVNSREKKLYFIIKILSNA
jgi:hypothetical protein